MCFVYLIYSLSQQTHTKKRSKCQCNKIGLDPNPKTLVSKSYWKSLHSSGRGNIRKVSHFVQQPLVPLVLSTCALSTVTACFGLRFSILLVNDFGRKRLPGTHLKCRRGTGFQYNYCNTVSPNKSMSISCNFICIACNIYLLKCHIHVWVHISFEYSFVYRKYSACSHLAMFATAIYNHVLILVMKNKCHTMYKRFVRMAVANGREGLRNAFAFASLSCKAETFTPESRQSGDTRYTRCRGVMVMVVMWTHTASALQ